ncbi:MAG: HAD family hydrolase, partial [Chloroflexi bacterium]|nr:HAD family hydrolase [Chloroflexota bacterium]
ELRERARDALQRQIDGSSELHFQFNLALMWRNVIEESSPDLVASLGPEGLVPFSQSLATIQRSQSRVQFELVNGAIETLEALAEHYRLGVVSDGQGAFVRAELRELGISRYFDVVVVAGDLGYRKPDPRLFRHAIEQLETDPTGSVYVGTDPERDAPVGPRRAGRRAGPPRPRTFTRARRRCIGCSEASHSGNIQVCREAGLPTGCCRKNVPCLRPLSMLSLDPKHLNPSPATSLLRWARHTRTLRKLRDIWCTRTWQGTTRTGKPIHPFRNGCDGGGGRRVHVWSGRGSIRSRSRDIPR